MYKQHTLGPITIITGLLLFCLLQYYARFILYGVYSFPTGDDLGFANATREMGVIGTVIHEYQTIIGRYSTVFLLGFVTHAESIVDAVRIYNVSIYTLLLIAATGLWHSLLKPINGYRFVYACLSALLMLCLFLGFIAYPWEVYFWTASTTQYQSGFVCCLTLLWLITARSSIPTPIYGVASCLLVIFIAGTVEVVSMLLPAMLVYLGLFEWYRTRRLRLDLTGLLVLALTCMMVVAIAPGNEIRHGATAPDPSLYGQHMFSAAMHLVQVAGKLIPVFGAAILALLPLMVAAATHYQPERFISWPRFLLLLAGGALAFYLVFMVPMLYAGYQIPYRGVFPVLFYLWLYVLFSSYLAIGMMRRYVSIKPALLWTIGAVFTGISIVGIGGFSYIRYMTYDIAALEQFDRTHEERLVIMAKARANGETTAILPPLTVRPAHLLYWDIGDEDKFGYREQYAITFGLKSVSVKK